MMRPLKYLLFIFLLFIPCISNAGVIAIRGNVKDAMISSKNDTLNYGTTTRVHVGYDTTGGNDSTRYLIQYDLAQLPTFASIDSVHIVLYQCSTAAETSISSGQLYLFKLDSSWSEGDSNAAKDTVNWRQRAHANQVRNVGWKTRGGDFNTAYVDSESFVMATDSITFRGDSLKAHFNRIYAGTQINNGFLVRTNNQSTKNKWVFASSDSSGREPQLVIYYSFGKRHRIEFMTRDSSGARTWTPDSLINTIAKAETAGVVAGLGDTINAHIQDSLESHAYLPKANVGDSARSAIHDTSKLLLKLSAAGDTSRRAVHDTAKVLRAPLTYQLFGVEMFQNLDTSQTINACDSAWFFQNFDGANPVLQFEADADSAEGVQNGTTVAIMRIEKGVQKLDSVRFWIKTKLANTDTAKINVYAGEYNFTTGAITYTDSSVNNTNTAWTLVRLTLSDNSYVAGDHLAIRIRFWSLEDYWCRVKSIILVQE